MSNLPNLAEFQVLKRALEAEEQERLRAELLKKNKLAAREQLLGMRITLTRSRPINVYFR